MHLQISTAREENGPLYAAWETSKARLKLVKRRKRDAELRREYEAYQKANRTLTVPLQAQTDAEEIPTGNTRTAQANICEIPGIDDSNGNLSDEDDDTLEPNYVPIDPELLSQDEFDRTARGQVDETLASVSLGLPDEEHDSVAPIPRPLESDLKTTNVGPGGSPASHRLHGAYRSHPGQRLEEGRSGESQVLRHHCFDTLVDDTCNDSLSSLDLANRVFPFFKTMHAVERYGALAPLPSTFICTSCNQDQLTKDAFEEHVTTCRRETVLRIFEQEYLQKINPQMAVPCDWLLKGHQGRCGKLFTTIDKFLRHILQHTYRNASPFCRYGNCVDMSTKANLDSRDAWADHIASVHGSTYMRASSLIFWCAFCDAYISNGISGPSARESHYSTHINEALDSIQSYGYNEVLSTVEGIAVLSVRHPWFCIFCVHQSQLKPSERLAVGNEHPGKSSLAAEKAHMLAHFEAIKDDVIACPASVISGAYHALCSSKEVYDAEGLENHLVGTHHIYLVKNLSSAKPKRVRVRGKAALVAKVAEAAARDDEEASSCEDENDVEAKSKPPKKPKTGTLKERSTNVP